jgi:hypothetical protein
LVESKRTWYLNDIDGATSGDFSLVALAVPGNKINVQAWDWDSWLKQRSRRHRYRITENLDADAGGIRVESSAYAHTQGFAQLLEKQLRYLSDGYWQEYDEECRPRCEAIWSAWIRALCQAEHLNPLIWILSVREGLREKDIAAACTVTIGSRRFFLIALMDHQYEGAGVCVLAHAIKASVEDPDVHWFDLMMGNNHYKRLYEPDFSVQPNYLLAVYPEVFWTDPNMDVPQMPIPPFIAAGKLYQLRPEEIPALLPRIDCLY